MILKANKKYSKFYCKSHLYNHYCICIYSIIVTKLAKKMNEIRKTYYTFKFKDQRIHLSSLIHITYTVHTVSFQ